jgi:hypothetical protein
MFTFLAFIVVIAGLLKFTQGWTRWTLVTLTIVGGFLIAL